MHDADLGERAISVNGELIACAKVDLETRRPSEGTAERTGRIGKLWPGRRSPQRTEINRCSVGPVKRRLFDQFAVIPGKTCLEGQCGGGARPGGGLEASHAVTSAIDGAAREHAFSERIDLGVIPFLLVDRTIPLKALTQPHRLPPELIVDERVRSVDQGRGPSSMIMSLDLPRFGLGDISQR